MNSLASILWMYKFKNYAHQEFQFQSTKETFAEAYLEYCTDNRVIPDQIHYWSRDIMRVAQAPTITFES
jgi:hypothetical protein